MLKKLLLATGVAAVFCLNAEISGLNGEFRNGQLFLRWSEKNLASDVRLSVWSSDSPITRENISSAVKIAGMLNVNSARDWWLDPDSFFVKRSKKAKGEEIFAGNVSDVGAKKNADKGFVISDNAAPISPEGGLHVHTPCSKLAGKRYYAVTTHNGGDSKVIEFTSTASAIEVSAGKAMPISIRSRLKAGSAKGMPLVISLHGRGGGAGIDRKGNSVGTHILFSDRNIAWREGIPFKFSVSVSKDKTLNISLNDRVWIGRKLNKKESRDSRDYVPAIASFWMGYNVNIAHSNEGPEFRWDNYTERMIIHVAKWAQEYLGADKNRTYITGGSMGGTGTVQMVTHYPEFFAAGLAQVPIYAFSWKKSPNAGNSAWRMTCSIGKFTEKNPAKMPDGTDLVDYSNGAKNISKKSVDMPPLFATNGRNDSSIPWVNNPDFYRGANEGRQMFAVYWNNGNHGMSRQAPRDFISNSQMMRYRLNESFPAFSNMSDNRNYGNGDHRDGDLVGWINRGIRYQVVQDTPSVYEIKLAVSHKDIKYPVTSDVTIRRRQQFKPAKGAVVAVSVNGREQSVTIDEDGLLTIKGITFKNGSFITVKCMAK